MKMDDHLSCRMQRRETNLDLWTSQFHCRMTMHCMHSDCSLLSALVLISIVVACTVQYCIVKQCKALFWCTGQWECAEGAGIATGISLQRWFYYVQPLSRCADQEVINQRETVKRCCRQCESVQKRLAKQQRSLQCCWEEFLCRPRGYFSAWDCEALQLGPEHSVQYYQVLADWNNDT